MKTAFEWAISVALGFIGSEICAKIWDKMNSWILIGIAVIIAVASRVGIWIIDKKRHPHAQSNERDPSGRTIDHSDAVGQMIDRDSGNTH